MRSVCHKSQYAAPLERASCAARRFARDEGCLKLLAMVAAILLPLLLAGGLAVRDDRLRGAESSAKPMLTSPTPRTVTDERQLRIVATAIPGPHTAFTVRC